MSTIDNSMKSAYNQLDIVNVLGNSDMSKIRSLMNLCCRSYEIYNDSYNETSLSFHLEVGAYEFNLDLDNRKIKTVSESLHCCLAGDKQWSIDYYKPKIEEMAIFDSILYKVFESLLNKYELIIIEGTYDIKNKNTWIEEVNYINKET